MHLTTLATLFLPLLLSSVLAAPTPAGYDSANGDVLKVRQCGPGISQEACDAAEECSPDILATNSCQIDEGLQSMYDAEADGEDPGA